MRIKKARKPYSTELKDVGRPPQGEPWIWLGEALLISPAWRYQTLHTRRLLDFLMLEQMHNAGTENGNLAAPYDQLVRFGIGRRFIPEAIRQAEALRLIVVARGGKRNLVADHISRYRLTWLASVSTESGTRLYLRPENEWSRTTEEEAAQTLCDRTSRRRPRKQRLGSQSVNGLGTPTVNRLGAHSVTDA